MANPKSQKTDEVIDVEVVDDAPTKDGGLARYQRPERELAITPVFNLAKAKARMAELQSFVKEYLIDGEDFGTIPGTPKPTLFKSGADKLCDIYGLADEYQLTSRTEDWSQNLFDFEIQCRLINKRDGQLVSTGVGSCSSWESKYRWRDQRRKCPKCGVEAIIKGKTEFGGGYICWKKEGKSNGCGAKFAETDPSIINQPIGRVANEDLADQKNTILKMAKKRAKIDAVLGATRSSGLFTQDIEDWAKQEAHEETGAKPPTQQQPPQQQQAKPAPAQPAAKPPQTAKATPAPAPKGSGVPKADIPKPAAAPKETPKPPPTAAPQPAPAAPLTNSQRGKNFAAKIQASTQNLTAFMFRELGATPDTIRTIPSGKMTAIISALEVSGDKFTREQMRPFICDEPTQDPSVRSYFNMAYARELDRAGLK